MATINSFTGYVRHKLENPLFNEIASFIEDKTADDLRLRLYKVQNPYGIELDRIDVKRVNVSDLPDSEIEFEVIAEATLIVTDADRYHNDESEITSQWFSLSCRGSLNQQLSDLDILSVTTYDSRMKQNRPMSDSLVPIIYKTELEQEAERFLQKYYPEALKSPMFLNPSELANRMGLAVIKHSIAEDTSVFGQIYFSETDAELYDSENSAVVYEHVCPGTIIVDPNVAFQRNLLT